ncbi:hypothetical protein JKP75_16775 [Blastococcus sp. TML/M2B]|uniref:hypothetical protein n=1 Tax=unclassified Blastococcus TaxID=2619396 RepID=UPI00190B518E|nr:MULTISPECIES: hypothetical protein [unclassified Blastococcus]MBN1094062.1 hypothetical protein [Blastococcus sp. TML/M2B]MBN1095818.1 hypothetical protein [Blastococcus sp. TML/C7B]
MGKHTAGDDATVHPLVADALARRSGAPGTAHGADAPGRGGSTGWPDPPPPGGEPVGWPEDPGGREVPDEGDGGADRDGTALRLPQRRGWRRLFGANPAA